jgi:hypothetical protein
MGSATRLQTAAAAMLLAAAAGENPGSVSGAGTAVGTWMPDVAERVASLRARMLEPSASQAEGQTGNGPESHWWREVVVAPSAEKTP